MHALTNVTELERLGDLIERGQHCAADLAIVRAIPGPYRRAQATDRHFALFADYRQWDR